MLDFNGLNYFAIIIAWLINIVVGSFWYSPRGFGKQWSRLSGHDMMKIPKTEANKAIFAVAISAIVQTVVLAVILNSLKAVSAMDGIYVGLLVWLGFTAATTVGNNLYSRLSWKFWWINASFFLLVMVVNSIILSIWE